MHVSIIIVNYNTKDLARDCLKSIFTQTQEIEFEVIVSDNGSTDGSVEMIKSEFPQVVLIENGANLGFGTANNQGLKIAKGEFIFYLNSDTILLNNAVKIFYDWWRANDDGTIGAIGCNLVDKDGNVNGSHGSFLFLEYPNKYIIECFAVLLRAWCKSFFHIFGYKFKPVIHNVKAYLGETPAFIIGADLFVKNNEFAKFDENIFMYCDELDLQWDMKENGLRRFVIDGPKIIHLEGGSTAKKRETREVLDLGRFDNINTRKNKIYLLKKYKRANFIQLFILKLELLFLWLNPLIFSKTKCRIREMLSI